MGCDLDTNTLPRAEAQELTRLIKQAKLEKAQPKRSDKARDLQNYEIAVESDDVTAKATLDDMSVDSGVEPLLDFLRDRARPMPLDR